MEALVCGASYVLVDFPRVGQPAANRAEEEALGASRAYLVEYRAEDLINWNYDEEGNYDWVVIRTSRPVQGTLSEARESSETRWLYYDKEKFRIYRATQEQGKKPQIEQVDEGRHGLAGQRRVPLFPVQGERGSVADEQGGAAATGALQQVQRAGAGR